MADPPGPAADDRIGRRSALFGGALVLALATGFGIGRLTGPAAGPAPDAAPSTTTATTGAGAAGGSIGGHVHGPAVGPAGPTAATATATVGGLAGSAGGLTLVPESTTFLAGRRQPLRFQVAGAGDRAVTAFEVVHDKPLHLIVVRRDLSGYQHLHPTMSADGTWQVELTLPTAGTWHAYADFTAIVGGQPTAATLGVDLNVAGSYQPIAVPPPARQDGVAGLTVGYAGELRTGATQPLLFWVTGPDGRPAALQRYLGSYGHLVVLREGDLSYLHVHPEPELADGVVRCWLAAPAPGRYRMFFDFQVGGQVHTAAFTATVS